MWCFSACDCHDQGSLNPFCRQTDGQCTCAATAFGRRCNYDYIDDVDGNANSRDCDARGCHPKTGNLLIGREDKLSATSTDNNESHSIKNIVSRYDWNDGPYSQNRVYLTWWQSEKGAENVTIELDLEAEYMMTGLFMTFRTQLPAAMSIDHSVDRGETWSVLQYFAEDCGVDATCVSKFSSARPLANGSVIYRVPQSMEEEEAVRKITNLRINLLRLHDESDYFSVYEMMVYGRCWCNGHAQRCTYGICDCQHFTMGKNCERCMDMFNDAPWRPDMECKSE